MSVRILLLENIHPKAASRLEAESLSVTRLAHSPPPQELCALLKNFDLLGIRSKTELDSDILNANPHLLAIGAFCIGTNQVDLTRATSLGIPVFNAPHSNTRSVAELIVSEIIALSRQLFDRSQRAHEGEWQKDASGSREVRGKTLGIVGYGHIGSQVSILAEALGMKVRFFDVLRKLPLGNAQPRSSLKDLLVESDFVTLHVPETPETRLLIGAEELALFKPGSYLLNASRGSVVDLEALKTCLDSGKIAGAAIDVFPQEPASNKEKFLSPLQRTRNVILTPHIGGSTEEAQYMIGQEVAESFVQFLQTGRSLGAVNFPQVDLPRRPGTRRILNVHRNEPGVLGEINSVVSSFGANIVSQNLGTFADVGYLVFDFEAATTGDLAGALAELPRSLKTRELLHRLS